MDLVTQARPARALPHVTPSAAAVRTVAERCRARGPQVLIIRLSAGPAMAALRDRHDFVPAADHVGLGQVAGCRAYVDTRLAACCPHDGLILEMWLDGAGVPMLVTRGESDAERQDRVLQARIGTLHQAPIDHYSRHEVRHDARSPGLTALPC